MGIPPHRARLAGAWAVQTDLADEQSGAQSGPASDLPTRSRADPSIDTSARTRPRPGSLSRASCTRCSGTPDPAHGIRRRPAVALGAADDLDRGRVGDTGRTGRRHEPLGEHPERRLGGVLPRRDHRAGPTACLDEARGLELLEGGPPRRPRGRGRRRAPEPSAAGHRARAGPSGSSASTCARTCSKGFVGGGVDGDVEFGHPVRTQWPESASMPAQVSGVTPIPGQGCSSLPNNASIYYVM